jgi:crossover junction endodeoxyribonuclease RuvC
MATFTAIDLTLETVALVRILGIDPGTQVVGYSCLELATGLSAPGSSSQKAVPIALRGSNVVRASSPAMQGVRLLAAGVLRLGGRSADLTARLLSLSDQFAVLLKKWEPTELAIEEAYVGKSMQSALRIGEARGVLLAASAKSGMDVFQYTPARVKRCVTGNGSASKVVVANMLSKLMPSSDAASLAGLSEDATDAVAVAWTRWEQRNSPVASGTR